MSAQVALPPPVVTANINYYLELNEGGTNVIYPGTAGDKLRRYNSTLVQITDVRNCDDQFTLDTHGFQFVQHKSAEATFDDEARVKSDVYTETAELLKNVTGASRVIPFSHLIRRQLFETAVDAATKAEAADDIINMMTPSFICHVDQSYDGAKQVLDHNTSPSDAEQLGKTRWGIINVWRPIERPVLRDPLAVCDSRSVAETDLRKVFAQLPHKGDGSSVSRGKGFEVWNVAHNLSHKWYYASRMTPNETLLIKCFDSKKDGRARRVPHSAFQTKFDQGPPRQSIEVRCLVFWEDENLE